MEVSALVSAYYAESFMVARMDNLIRENVEIVVICQRDTIEHRIAAEYPCTLVVTEDIPTLYRAWNLGIERATGKYLTSANTDDIFYPGALATMAEHMDAHGCALVCGDCDLRTGSVVTGWKRRTPPVSHDYCTVGSMPMWRKDLHTKYGLFDESMTVCGDWDFWLRLLDGGERICHIDSKIGLYWKREDSIEHRNSKALAIENKVIRERFQK